MGFFSGGDIQANIRKMRSQSSKDLREESSRHVTEEFRKICLEGGK